MVESIFSKVTEENSAFYKCFENSIRCSSINISISISIEGALLEISRSSLLTSVTGSHPTSCKATKIWLGVQTPNQISLRFLDDLLFLDDYWMIYKLRFSCFWNSKKFARRLVWSFFTEILSTTFWKAFRAATFSMRKWTDGPEKEQLEQMT